MPGGGTTSVQTSPGISCSLYPAVKTAPSNTAIEGLKQPLTFKMDLKKSPLQKSNKNVWLNLYMDTEGENVPTRVGPAPLGGYFNYQIAPTEGNFKVACNVDLPKQRNSEN